MKFELQTLPRNCSDDDVLAEIRRVDSLVEKDVLTQTDYNKYAKMFSDGVKLRFGSWEKALIAAGLGHKYFGTEISEKMRQQKAQHLTDEEVLNELKRVAKVLGEKILTRTNFDRNSEIGSGTFVSRFGGWYNALKRAGLENKYSGKVITENMRKPGAKTLSNNDVLRELQRIAKLLNKETVTVEDVRTHSNIMSVGVVGRRFGSWTTAMEKAGLKVSKMYHRGYSEEEYFENLLNVWIQHGRQPRYGEMNIAPSKISAGTYTSHFGNWHKALHAFVSRMNQDEREFERVSEEKNRDEQSKTASSVEIIKPRPKILIEDKRNISLSLRYNVLNRDKFKCVRCGSSPATDQTCRLHVDHALPFSKGGKTTLENLQTLCEKCNLGKGNRHSG